MYCLPDTSKFRSLLLRQTLENTIQVQMITIIRKGSSVSYRIILGI